VSLLLGSAALAVGTLTISPVAGALSGPIVGGAVPTRLRDVFGYCVAPKGEGTTPAGQLGPISPTDPTQSEHLRELGALSVGAGLAVAALAYVLLRRLLG
jgi:hypothetical protein